MLSSESRYLYAQIAVGDAAGPKPFYRGLCETIKSTDPPCIADNDDLNCNPTDDPSSGMEVTQEEYEGMKNLDIMIDTIEKMEAKGMEVINQAIALKDKFVADVSCRLRSNDINYALGITSFSISTFKSTIKVNQQLQQHLNWRLFFYMANKYTPIHCGTHHISVQPTALQCRRKGVSCGLQNAPQGRPLKIKANSSFQTKCSRPEHIKENVIYG